MSLDRDSTGTAVVSGVGRALAILAMALLIVNVLLVGYDVLLRWLLGWPQSWVADIAAMTYPVALACCIPAALESGHMIAIRFLGQALGPRATRWLDSLGSVLLLLLMALMAWKVSERTLEDWNAGYTTANAGFPMSPTWLLVSVLLIIATLVQVRLVWRTLPSRTAGAAHAG